ncbi:HPr family phosphocarrier protein [Edwardsiella hoshinae]|uniref:Hydroxypyruvate isomerase n=1 Tax=Edwardsiella hoshinae TaxID=93378 RepID=A0A376DEQ4_9GAMM|nr:HPr family phosphocarrier protein [Edwardsiella hoshinae]QPR27309.1 HPr family phosphocarrier protein [Edwardsiella hoshinae]STC87779.1 Hydroxypyruvate isomerase [Edwardsiella hoshinae]
MPRFAANLSTMFCEYPFTTRFAAAAQAGFHAVEFLFPYGYPAADLRRLLDDHRLTLALFNTPPGDTNAGQWGRSALPGAEAAARADIDLALSYAQALACQRVHVMAGVIPPGERPADCRRVFIRNLRYAADRFAEHGKQILVEALSPSVKPGYLFSSQYQALAIVDEVDRPNLAIQLDLFHAQRVDGNLTQLIRDYAGRYGHVQIASVPDRHEPDEGEISYPWLFNLLDQVGYTGWVGCEYTPRAETLSGLSWLNALR